MLGNFKIRPPNSVTSAGCLV